MYRNSQSEESKFMLSNYGRHAAIKLLKFWSYSVGMKNVGYLP